jgi:hypothetical protein
VINQDLYLQPFALKILSEFLSSQDAVVAATAFAGNFFAPSFVYIR